jgi:hypothetical protein
VHKMRPKTTIQEQQMKQEKIFHEIHNLLMNTRNKLIKQQEKKRK